MRSKLNQFLNLGGFKTFLVMAAFAVTTGILVNLVYRQRGVFFSYRWHIDLIYLLLAYVVFSFDLILVTYVWVRIIHSFECQISFRKHFRNFCVSNLARRLPGSIWYIAYRNRFYKDEGLPVSATSLASGIELAVSLISAVLVVLVFSAQLLLKSVPGTIASVVLLTISLAFLHPRIFHWVIKRITHITYQIRYKSLLGWVACYILVWIAGGLILFCTISIFYPIHITHLGYITGCVALAGLFSRALLFSPTNFGITEISLSLMLTAILPAPVALIASIMNRILTTLFDLLWALITLLLK